MYDPIESYRAYREQQAIIDADYASKQNAINEALSESRYEAMREEYNSPISIKASLRSGLGKFKTDVYKAFVAESVSLLAACAVKAVKESDAFDYQRETAVLKSLAETWVNEQSMYDIQSKMNSSVVLSSFDCACKKYTDIVVEKANKKIDKGETDKGFVYTIDDDDRDAFYKELDAVNADELVYSIRDRVADASQEFMDTYMKDKMAIKAVLKDTKTSVDALRDTYKDTAAAEEPEDNQDSASIEYDPYTANNAEEDEPTASPSVTSEAVQESYTNLAKRKINAIMHKPCASVYETMVINLSTAAFKNEILAEEFVMENAKLDTEAIRTRVGVMYTWLETLNTANLENVNEEFLKNTLDEIKNMK